MKKVVAPGKDEDRDTFIARCMSAEATAFPDADQRLAVCNSKFTKAAHSTGPLRQGKRRRMKKFMIGEISAVNRPAVEGAQALILKRADIQKDFDEDRAIVLLTSETDGHTHAVWVHPGMRGGETSFGVDPDKDNSHDHPWVLDATGQITIGENDGHTHTVDPQQIFEMIMNVIKLEKRARVVSSTKLWDDYAVKLADSDQEDHMPDPKPTNDEAVKAAEDRATEAEAKVTELEATAKRAGQVAELTDAQKAHFSDLDEDGQTTYLGKSVKERQAVITKAEEDNAVVYTDVRGNEFRKSDDPRLVQMAKDRDEDRKELIKARAERSQEGFEKRASETLSNLPGELATHAAVIQAIDGIEDEDVRKAAHEAIVAGNKAMKAAFTTTGGSGTVETDAEKELDNLAKAYAAKENIDYFTAYEAVSASNSDLRKRAIEGN